MVLTTEQIIELLKNREDVHVCVTDEYAERVSVELGQAKKVTIIVNNHDPKKAVRLTDTYPGGFFNGYN